MDEECQSVEVDMMITIEDMIQGQAMIMGEEVMMPQDKHMNQGPAMTGDEVAILEEEIPTNHAATVMTVMVTHKVVERGQRATLPENIMGMTKM